VRTCPSPKAAGSQPSQQQLAHRQNELTLNLLARNAGAGMTLGMSTRGCPTAGPLKCGPVSSSLARMSSLTRPFHCSQIKTVRLAVHRHLFRFIFSSVHVSRMASSRVTMRAVPTKQQNFGIAQRHENSMCVHKIFASTRAMNLCVAWDHLQSIRISVPPPSLQPRPWKLILAHPHIIIPTLYNNICLTNTQEVPTHSAAPSKCIHSSNPKSHEGETGTDRQDITEIQLL
jgi:hypothetical protein